MGRLLELIDEFPAIRPLLPDIQPSLSSLQSILFFFFRQYFSSTKQTGCQPSFFMFGAAPLFPW